MSINRWLKLEEHGIFIGKNAGSRIKLQQIERELFAGIVRAHRTVYTADAKVGIFNYNRIFAIGANALNIVVYFFNDYAAVFYILTQKSAFVNRK